MPKITEIYGFITYNNGPKDEYLLAIEENGNMLPITSSTLEGIKAIFPFIKIIGRKIKKPITLVKFTNREEIEVIGEKDD